MKIQEMTVYREIQKNTEMAMTAINTISDKVYDDRLAVQISRQSMKYSEIHNRALDRLLTAGEEPYHTNQVADIMLKSGIGYRTLLNTSTSHIAELMIKGSNNGIMEMNKVLNRNEEAGQEPVTLAKELIAFEEKNIEQYKKYL